MRVLINQIPHDLPDGATLADAVQVFQASGPYAAAVNLRFVPRSQYTQTVLNDNDTVELITPVTGG